MIFLFWKCSGKNLSHQKWLKEAIEAGAAGADVDVKEMLGALKNAAAGENVGENLEYVAEFCEVRFFWLFYIYCFVFEGDVEKIDTSISIIK